MKKLSYLIIFIHLLVFNVNAQEKIMTELGAKSDFNYKNGSIGIGVGATNPDGNMQIGGSTTEGMLFLGGGKGYAGIGSVRSDGGLALGWNIYSRYTSSDGGIVRVAQAKPYQGYTGIKLSPEGVIDFFGHYGSSVVADEIANKNENIRMRISRAGNVGIGVLNPYSKLSVNGNINLVSGVNIESNNGLGHVASKLYLNSHNDARGAGLFSIGQTNTWFWGNPYLDHANSFIIANRPTEVGTDAIAQKQYAKFYLNQDGDIGVGTTTPGAKLHINNGDNSYGAILANANEVSFSLYSKSLTTQANSETFRLGLKYGTEERNGFISFYRGGSAFGGFLGFSTYGVERMRINANGDIGIGTVNPESKLHVSDQVDGGFDGLVIDNRKIYGVGTGVNETSRIILSLSENGTPNPLDRIFGMIEAGSLFETTSSQGRLSFFTRNNGNTEEKMRIINNGNVGIGTITPDEKLAVNGKIHTKEVRVDLTGWSDFVFEENYELPTLAEVENHIKEKGHLADIPSEKEVKANGIQLGEMNAKLLQKIEELTLYTIEQEKKIEILEAENKKLNQDNAQFEIVFKRLESLEKKMIQSGN